MRSLLFSEGPENTADHRSHGRLRAEHIVEALEVPGPEHCSFYLLPAAAPQAFLMEIYRELTLRHTVVLGSHPCICYLQATQSTELPPDR